MFKFSSDHSYQLLPQSKRSSSYCTCRNIRNAVLAVVAFTLYTGILIFYVRNGPPSYGSPLLSSSFVCHDTASCLLHFPDNTTLPPPVRLPSQNNRSFDARQYAFVSALYTPTYLRAALALGYSIQKNHKTQNYPMYLLHLHTTHFTQIERCQLSLVGWTLMPVPSIPAPSGTPKNFRDNFAKLNLWALVDLDAVIYLDADMLVLQPIDEAFQLVDEKFSPFEFAAALDNWGGVSQDFNAGMMILRPSLPMYAELLRLYKYPGLYPTSFAEQSFLNELFRMRFLRLPDIWNLNIAFTDIFPSAWKEVVGDAKLIHFTRVKPMVHGRDGQCRDNTWKEVCGIWDLAWKELKADVDLEKCQNREIKESAIIAA